MSHWLNKNKILNEAPENAFGFIYKITNTTNDKMYIGRKYFEKKRRVKKKGQSRRKVIRKSSDWQTYTGSSKPLIESISQAFFINIIKISVRELVFESIL